MFRIICLLTFLCCGYGISAQINVGIKLGLATTGFDQEQINILDQGGLQRFGLALRDGAYSIHGGLMLRARIGKVFHVQPELLLQSNKTDYSLDDLTAPVGSAQVLTEKYQHLNLPLMLGAQWGAFRVQAGPQGHVFLSSRSDLSKVEGYQEDFKKMTLSWVAGAGIDIWKTLTIDLRYEGSLNRLGDHIRFFGNSYSFEDRPARLSVSAGLLFGKKKR